MGDQEEYNDGSSDSSSTKFERKSGQSKESEKKFISSSAEKLERKLIEKEFYKHYSQNMIWVVFANIFLSNIFINVDHGSLPGCSIDIKQDLSMQNFEFGLLGSIVYGGLVVGSGVATGIYSKSKWIKPTIIGSLVMNSVCIILFTITNSFYFDCFLRFWIGFFQVFLVIYMPVWGDSFASENQKSAWLTFLILASPLGVVGGFTMTSIFTAFKTWRWSFYVQGLCMVPCAITFCLTPAKYLDIEGTVRFRKRCAHIVQQKLYKHLNSEVIREMRLSHADSRTESVKSLAINETSDFLELLESFDNEFFTANSPVPKNKENIMAIRQKALQKLEKQIKKIDNGRASNLDSTGFGGEKKPFMEELKSVISNKVFVALCMCLTGLFFVVTGIQYWAPDYLKKVLEVDDHTASVYFATTSLFAPVSGVIIGGIITTSYGGYNSRKAQLLQCVLGCIAVLSALPIPFMSDFFYIGILFWILLFCGGFILPPVTGIMINSVGDYQKSSANSVANLIYNLLGFAPAPGLYGFVSQVTGSDRWSMGFLMYSTIFTVGSLLYGIHHKLKREEEFGLDSKRQSIINNKAKTNCNDSRGNNTDNRDPFDEL